ncbi:ATP-binding protein [Kitasatospora camelliae]|uniref:ATP-binding protein n=1 Tax=Kitasatospora camelliae TaxID=3156397 RepID=A0AAU8JT26_9ACTN
MGPSAAMTASHHRRLVFDPPGTAACVSAGVAFVRRALEDWELTDSPVTETDAVLVVAELLGNAVRHGGGALRVDLDQQGTRLQIAVTDPGPGRPVPARGLRPDRVGGHGLVIVDRLSLDWGSIPNAGGKTVWADLALPGL